MWDNIQFAREYYAMLRISDRLWGVGLKRNIVFGTLLSILSLYIALLLGEAALLCIKSTPDQPKVPRSPQMFADWNSRCPKTESLHFDQLQSMGPELIRQPAVGWLLWPGRLGNEKGYLGPCYPYKKPANTLRIVFIGDSFTGATQVPYESTFVSLVEAGLGKRLFKTNVEVINLGVGGYGTDQEYLTLINEASKYKPDIVVQDIYLGNDIRDNSHALARHADFPVNVPHPIKSYFQLSQNGVLEPDQDKQDLCIIMPETWHQVYKDVIGRLSSASAPSSEDFHSTRLTRELTQSLAVICLQLRTMKAANSEFCSTMISLASK